MPALTYTADDYNRYFLNQLYELLTEYGEIGEVWFDGANPDSSTSQTYDRAAWYDLIRRLQPNAVIAVKGPDVRWVGNENGNARDGEWSAIPISSSPATFGWGDMTATDLGSRSKLTRGSYLTWYPAEADVPVLNGWFWSASKTPRTASALVNLYYTSVGRNANLLLNLSPDTRGLIPSNQLASLRSMGQVLGQTFATNLAAGGTCIADSSDAAHPASLTGDEDLDTWWEASSGQTTGTLTLTLPSAVTFDVISLQEAIAQRGQRIESLAVDTWQGGAWTQAATTTNIGHKRLIRLSSAVTSDRVRIRILQSRMEPTLAQIGLFRQADLVTEPTITRSVSGSVTLAAGTGESIRYTLDGSDPTDDSPLYSAPFPLVAGGTVKAIAWRANGSHSLPSTKVFGIAPTGWTATADTAQGTNPASYAIDGNTATYWHTAWNGSGLSTAQPHWLSIDMSAARWLRGFTYLPRQDGAANGIVSSWRCESSENGTTWNVVTSGTFANIKNNPVEQQVIFDQPIHARFVRFVSLAEINGATFASAAEIGLLAGGYDGWRSDKGLPPETGAAGAPWRDYALGPGAGSLPAFAWSANTRGGFRFLRSAGLTDVIYTLEAAASPVGPWQMVPAEVMVQSDPSGLESVSLAEIDPPEAPRRFYRLRYAWAP
ncbi:MAG: discoidin domain-containing protein [Luteolibacter sp.]